VISFGAISKFVYRTNTHTVQELQTETKAASEVITDDMLRDTDDMLRDT
jgi:hypothetical protein